jgi:hypothetical protein
MPSQNFSDFANQAGSAGKISFFSVITGETIEFPAFVTGFQDNYTVNWGGETVFGRNDPVKHYQSTNRQIQASFDILGSDMAEATDNFKKYSKMIQLLYPVYSKKIGSSNNARTIRGAPFWRIKYANYIRSENANGLLGCLQGISFQPKFEVGHFVDKNKKLIPISYSMNFTFQPLHESPLGTQAGGKRFLTKNFPYNFKTPTGGGFSLG